MLTKKLITKNYCGNCVYVTILGIIKFSYKKKRRCKLTIRNRGINNIINGKNCKTYKSYGRGYINVNGNNNIISIDETSTLDNTKIDIRGDNVHLNIKKNCIISGMTAVISGGPEEVLVEIGNNVCTGNMEIYAGGQKNNNLIIGDDCLFSRDIVIYTHDGHPIFDKDTNECINNTAKPVIIGNNVWLGQGVYILKNVSIPNNTIVGAGSIVTKSFDEENTIIAGNPAKIVRRKVCFKK